MAQARSKTDKADKEKSKYTVSNSLVSYYLAIMFSFFPLFLTEQYSHARTDKFWFYVVLTVVLAGVVTPAICKGIGWIFKRIFGKKEAV